MRFFFSTYRHSIAVITVVLATVLSSFGCVKKSEMPSAQKPVVAYSEDAEEVLQVDSDILDEVVSEANLSRLISEKSALSGSLSLNAFLSSDWKSRLPLRLKSGLVKYYVDLNKSDEIVGLGDVMVNRFKPSERHLQSLGRIAKIQKRSFAEFDLARIELKSSDAPVFIERMNQINRLPGVLFLEPNSSFQVNTTPNDARWPEQWGMAAANLPWVWSHPAPKVKTIVALIDSGIDYKHVDLKSNIWINNGEIPGNGIDDDKNGYIDDVHGWNFWDDNNVVSDLHGHGTHCAGIAGAEGHNSFGIAGAHWRGKLMPVKILSDTGLGDWGAAYEGILYAISNGAKILSNSYGSHSVSAIMANAMELASSSGVLVVASAGNDSRPTSIFPAKYTKDFGNILSVGSVDQKLSLSPFSNFLDGVDLAAPGSAILSTLPDNRYGIRSGTSMSAPLVAGAAALLWDHFPQSSALELRSAILRGATVLPSLEGKISGGRLINAQSAFQLLNQKDGVPIDPVERGLRFQLFGGKWKKSGDLVGKAPMLSGSIGRISTRFKTNKKNFAVVYESNLKLKESGEYSFYPSSDGRVELFIDGAQVNLYSVGNKNNSQVSGTAILSSGYKKIRIVYMSSDGRKSLKLLWSGPNLPKQNINNSGVLFY